MEKLDYEGIFSREAHAIITCALHERGIDAITEDELELLTHDLRAQYLRCRGELRRHHMRQSIVGSVRFRW